MSNRRVIVPDLGAFISDPVENTIVFSTLLKNNDGLLESKLRETGIANPEFLLKKYVSGIFNALERGDVFNIRNLGYFYRENDGLQLQFKFVENRPENEENAGETSEKVKNKPKTKLFVMFFVLTVVILSLFLIYKFCIETTYNSTSTQPDNRFIVVDKTMESDSSIEFYGTEQSLFAGKRKYYVVAACFEKKINAERFVIQCVNEGYTNAEILSPMGDLFPVAVDNSISYGEAIKRKNEYDDRFRENTWIYATR